MKGAEKAPSGQEGSKGRGKKAKARLKADLPPGESGLCGAPVSWQRETGEA